VKQLRGNTGGWNNRAHFFAAASLIMRRILADDVRQRVSHRRPAGKARVELDEFMASTSPRIDQLLIDEALTRFAEWLLSDTKRRVKFYSLAKAGRKQQSSQTADRKRLSGVISAIVLPTRG
jgi:hypothetical protein